jgi:hypothetical protein
MSKSEKAHSRDERLAKMHGVGVTGLGDMLQEKESMLQE